MGRARGGPQAAAAGAAAPTRRTGTRTPAEALGLATGAPATDTPARRIVAPQGAPIVSVRGVSLYRADSTDPTLTVPAHTVGGLDAYPQLPREGKARLDGELWQRLARAGRVYRIEGMRSALWRAGVGTRALGGKGADGPIAEARLREEFHAWAHEGRLPAGSDVPLPDSEDERGFGILRTRQACRDYVRHLRSRPRSQMASLHALAHGAPLWFEASEAARAAWQVPDADPERVSAVLGLLADGGWHKSRALVEAVWGEELRAANDDPERLERALRDKASSLRALAAKMRAAGVPVVGNPARGYRLAEHMGELHTYFEAERVRADAVEAHARQIEVSGALWYPEGAAEQAAADKWRSSLQRGQTAPQTLKRAAQRRASRERSEGKRQTVREQAAQREAELMAQPVWARTRAKSAAGLALTSEERAFRAELDAQRKAKKSGRAPGGAKREAAPRPAPKRASGGDAIPPPPW